MVNQQPEPNAPQPGLNDKLGQIAATTSIYACAAVGGFIGGFSDVMQKGEASAVSKIVSVFAVYFGTNVYPFFVLAGLVSLAVFLCFVAQARDRRAAFAVGLGVTAVIMTATPYERPPSGKTIASISASSPNLAQRVGYDTDSGKIVIPVINNSENNMQVEIRVFDENTRNVYSQTDYLRAFDESVFTFDWNIQSGGSVYYEMIINEEKYREGNLNLRDDIYPIFVNPDASYFQERSTFDRVIKRPFKFLFTPKKF